MRFITRRFIFVGLFICLILLLIQLRLLDFWYKNCPNRQCWPIFDYDVEQTTKNATQPIELSNKHLKTLPSALIIGAKKGGTRALIDSLQLHPQILAAKREVHYFDDNYENGLEWYRDQMPVANNDQVVIEKTPAYLSKAKCVKRVFDFNPHIKLIVILRNPVTRTISDFTQVQYSRAAKNSTLLNFENEVFRVDGKTLNFSFKPVSNSLYVKHISAWLAYFPLSQFIFVDGDQFIHSPLKELKKVETFLGLDHQIDQSQIVFNERKGFYCFRARRRRIAKCLGESKGRKHVNISDASRELLRLNFQNYNEQFFQLINRRFNWS